MESGFAEGYAVGKDSSNGGFGGFGGYGAEWIWIIVLFALWQNGGWGNGGNGVGSNYVLATDFATIERKLDGVNNGLCDGFYAMNTGMLNGFSGVQNALCQGFSGVVSGINSSTNDIIQTINADTIANMQNTNAINAGITGLGTQMAQCCCDSHRCSNTKRYTAGTDRSFSGSFFMTELH